MPYRGAEALDVPADLVLPTCDRCGEIYLGAGDTERLDAALEIEYQKSRPSSIK